MTDLLIIKDKIIALFSTEVNVYDIRPKVGGNGQVLAKGKEAKPITPAVWLLTPH